MNNLPDPSDLEKTIETILRYINIGKAIFDIVDEFMPKYYKGSVDSLLSEEELTKLRQENEQNTQKILELAKTMTREEFEAWLKATQLYQELTKMGVKVETQEDFEVLFKAAKLLLAAHRRQNQ